MGKVIRSRRLDEVGQLLNVLGGSMSFVGTRPEVPKYVARYTPEMMATLLLPAGGPPEASIRYKDEAEPLDKAEDVDETYMRCRRGKWHIIWRASGALAWVRSC